MTLQDSTSGSMHRFGKRQLAAVAIGLAALVLGGCREHEDPTRVAGWSAIDPSHRHPIRVSREPEQMSVRVARGARGLTPVQRAEVIDFAARARAADAGNTKLVIAAPAGSKNEIESARAVEQIRHLFSEGGIADSSVGLEAYHAGTDAAAPVRVAFFRYVAQAPECGHWPANLADERRNLPYANFGCANQRNFANQVSNPADLVEPRSETERSSERRDVVWGKYREGKHTGAERKPNDDEKLAPIE
jgi:pilus assembly protein CpaD